MNRLLLITCYIYFVVFSPIDIVTHATAPKSCLKHIVHWWHVYDKRESMGRRRLHMSEFSGPSTISWNMCAVRIQIIAGGGNRRRPCPPRKLLDAAWQCEEAGCKAMGLRTADSAGYLINEWNILHCRRNVAQTSTPPAAQTVAGRERYVAVGDANDISDFIRLQSSRWFWW